MRPDRSDQYYNKIIYCGCQDSRENVITLDGAGVGPPPLRCLTGVFGRLDQPASSTDKTWSIENYLGSCL